MRNTLSVLTYSVLVAYTIFVALCIYMMWLPNAAYLLAIFAFGIVPLFGLALPFALIVCVCALIQKENRKLRIITPIWALSLVAIVVLAGFVKSRSNPLERLAENYELHHQELQSLKLYANSVLDADCALRLETKRGKVDGFAYADSAMTYLEWPEGDYTSAMAAIGLTPSELDSLILLIDEADCIGVNIYHSRLRDIWYSRPSYMDLYSYILLDEPMNEADWDKFEDYNTIPYCDTVVFEYGGPAFGSDVIPEKDRTRFRENHPRPSGIRPAL